MKMAKVLRRLPQLSFRALRPIQCTPSRCFSISAQRGTDGVYRELTAMRTRTPFIEAFRKQQENKLAKPISTDNVERDLSPKSMSDSFHKVVRHMISYDLTIRTETDIEADTATCERSMASRLVYQLIWTHSVGYYLYGS